MEKNIKKSHSVKNLAIMIFSIFLVVVVIPVVFIFNPEFVKLIAKAGIKGSPNFNDGYLIAQFEDTSHVLLMPLPDDSFYKNAEKALDIRKFAIKKVKFNTLSAMGIEARLNLCFEFDGKEPNPNDFPGKFSLPVIHVYIKSPASITSPAGSDKTANVKFENDGWNYQVIIDGMHDQARVYDNKGKFLFNGVGLYVNYDYEEGHAGEEKYITKTKITAGLPLNRIGDPAEGEWQYYVITGLLDVKNSSMLYCRAQDSLNVFDYIGPLSKSNQESKTSGRVSLQPLIVNYSETHK